MKQNSPLITKLAERWVGLETPKDAVPMNHHI